MFVKVLLKLFCFVVNIMIAQNVLLFSNKMNLYFHEGFW